MAGILYLCATPIGNLEDMTPRAQRMLAEADIIAAEDTRHTLQLLNRFNIKGRLVRYDEHSKEKQGAYLLGELMDGKNVAESETRTGRLCMFSDILEELESCVKEHRLGVRGILSDVKTFSPFPYILERSDTGWKYAYDLTGLAWAKKLQLTDVITVLNPEDAEIGKSYRFADDLGSLAEGSAAKGTLTRIEEGSKHPFYDGEGDSYRYIVPENN